MLFNSLEFAVFLPVVFALYWFVFKKSIRLQNALIVVASYVFYGWWDWRFLSLIVFSTLLDYTIGRLLDKESKELRRKIYLWISIGVNLGFLGVFKYYNFFVDSFVDAVTLFGGSLSTRSLNIILPVGISFYTFQTLSYSIDVYRRQLQPTKDLVAFAAFVSFFPQLVAGPIERATKLLPQFYKERVFDYSLAMNGIRQIAWGLFKKIVIADNCSVYANTIFNGYTEFEGGTLLLGALMFTFQIYGDFSGYSDIAIGTARLFGFNLMRNFAFPYFSRDIAEFWRRWHISLSTWFRDYLYIPLGGSRGTRRRAIVNVFIIFIVSGFWHGANWTFIVWGALNAVYFLPLMLLNRNRSNLDIVAEDKMFPSLREFIGVVSTFLLTVLAWVFFRSESVAQAMVIIGEILSPSIVSFNQVVPVAIFVYIILFLIIEWLGRRSEFAIEKMYVRNDAMNYFLFLVLISSIYLFGNFSSKYEFIYFQF